MQAVANGILRTAPLQVRRATVIGAALATGARTLLFEDPTPGLRDEAARMLSRLVTRATRNHPWILFAARAPLDSPLALAADEGLVLSGSSVAAQGDLAELATCGRTYAVSIVGEPAAFAELVRARGGQIMGGLDAGAPRVTINLGSALLPRDLLQLAVEARSVVVELRPIARAFV